VKSSQRRRRTLRGHCWPLWSRSGQCVPLQYVHLFLNIVLEEGKSVSEYERDLGTAQTVMSRHLKEIGERTRSKQEGLGLVMQKADMNDMRKHLVHVTPLGKSTMHKVKLALHYFIRKK
jgi:DNA-binding MarR family transcriptional regulator